jgi:hypothetical protein
MNEYTVPRPERRIQSPPSARHFGQRTLGGQRTCAHAPHRCARSSSRWQASQYGAPSSVTAGSGFSMTNITPLRSRAGRGQRRRVDRAQEVGERRVEALRLLRASADGRSGR